MTTQNRITGIVQLTRPMHVASFGKSTDPAKDSTEPKKEKRKNYTRTVKTPILASGGVYYFPYFPGNDLRGRLRTKAAAIVLEHITVNGKVSLDLYAGLMSGSITNSPETGDLSAEEVLRARQNPYMGLFGGGTRLLRSRYRASDLLPIHAYTIEAGAIPDNFASHIPVVQTDQVEKPLDPWRLCSDTTIIRCDHVATVARPEEIERFVQDAQSTVIAYQERVMGAREDRKADKDRVKAGELRDDEKTKQVGLQNIIDYETIVAGTRMFFQLDFDNDTLDSHIGLALMSLRALVREQALGGVVRAGLGQFRADLKLTRNREEPYSIFIGNWAQGDAEFHEDVNPFVNAACEALKHLSAQEMLAYFVPREVKPRGKGKKQKNVEAEVE